MIAAQIAEMDVLSFASRRGVLFSKGIRAKCLTVSSLAWVPRGEMRTRSRRLLVSWVNYVTGWEIVWAIVLQFHVSRQRSSYLRDLCELQRQSSGYISSQPRFFKEVLVGTISLSQRPRQIPRSCRPRTSQQNTD
jgi:hypothetical protein